MMLNDVSKRCSTLRVRKWRNPVRKGRDLVEFVLLRYHPGGEPRTSVP